MSKKAFLNAGVTEKDIEDLLEHMSYLSITKRMVSNESGVTYRMVQYFFTMTYYSKPVHDSTIDLIERMAALKALQVKERLSSAKKLRKPVLNN